MMTERELEARMSRGYQDETGLDYQDLFETLYGAQRSAECPDCGLGHEPAEDCTEAVALMKMEGDR